MLSVVMPDQTFNYSFIFLKCQSSLYKQKKKFTHWGKTKTDNFTGQSYVTDDYFLLLGCNL